MHRPISELHTKPLCPVEPLHVLQTFNFPFQWWKYGSSGLGRVIHPLQIPSCSAGVPQQPTWWTPREHFGPKPAWVVALGSATSLLNPDHKVEDGSCVVFFSGTSPHLPCDLFVWHCMGERHCAYHMACSAFTGGSQTCSSVPWTVTPWWRMSYCVQRCFPFPHCPHAKINIWYESQGTEASWIVQKVLSPFSCCCYFFNIIFLMGWVTVYSRIKGWRRYFGISLSSSVFLLWNLGNFFWCLLWIFCLSAHLGFIFPPCRPPPPPSFHKWRRGEIVCMCVWCPAKQRN